MSEASSSNAKKSIEQPNDDLSEDMGQLSVTSNETSTPPKSIMERSDYKEQLISRKVSQTLREFVDKQTPTSLKVFCKFDCMLDLDCIICEYNDYCVAYVSPTWNRAEFSSDYEQYRLDTIIKKGDYEQVAFDDLAFILKNPKLQLETFSFRSEGFGESDDDDSFDFEDYYHNKKFSYKFKDMENLLKSIGHQLSVKTCGIDISCTSNAMSILPYLKPGILERIKILSNNGPMPQFEVFDQELEYNTSKTIEKNLKFRSMETSERAGVRLWIPGVPGGTCHSFQAIPVQRKIPQARCIASDWRLYLGTRKRRILLHFDH